MRREHTSTVVVFNQELQKVHASPADGASAHVAKLELHTHYVMREMVLQRLQTLQPLQDTHTHTHSPISLLG